MFDIVLTLHNITRWIVLIAGLLAAGTALFGWLRKKEWAATNNKLGLIYTISFDIQLILGLMLYFWLSPLMQVAFLDFGAAMSDKDMRFFASDHIFAMVLALVLAHVGRVLIKRTDSDAGKFKRAAIFFGLSILLVLGSIPWWRPLL